MKIGAAYSRVSVDESEEGQDNNSLKQQQNMAKEYAQSLSLRTGHKYQIKYFLTEEKGVSGKDTNKAQVPRTCKAY